MMIKHLQSAALVAVAALALTACNDENPWAGLVGKGGITLRLKTDSTVKDAVPTRATETLEAPDADLFKIRLEKSGAQPKEWDGITAFNTAEESFAVGTYTLSAAYGNPEVMGFNLPAYYGETQVTVLEGEPAAASITAKLANALVTVNFTDAFKAYFKVSELSFRCEGSDSSFSLSPQEAADEESPLYITAGEEILSLKLQRNIEGKEYDVTLQPTQFEAKAAHHYHITLDFNGGNVGEGSFSITFDETLEQNDIDIELSDELFTKPAPVVTAEGFESGNALELLTGTPTEGLMRMNINAAGYIKEAELTVVSDTYTPAWGKVIDLCKASPAQQQQLADAGINCMGLFKNPARFARVDLAGLKLPVGSHTFQLITKDQMTRVNDPVLLTVNVLPVSLDVEQGICIVGDTEAALTVAFNAPNPKDRVTFWSNDDNGIMEKMTVLSFDEVNTRAVETKTYKAILKLHRKATTNFDVIVKLDGEYHSQFCWTVVNINYDLAVADVFSTYAYLQVTTENPSDLELATKNVDIIVGGSKVGESNLERDLTTGRILVKNLTPSTTYTLTSQLGSISTPAVSMTAESAMAIPNGDFSELTETINISSINTGGQYTGTIFGSPAYQLRSSLLINEPTSWASINSKTAYLGSTNINTWFVAPSTLGNNGRVTIRSVGYNHSGTTPSLTKKTSVYYCQTAPTFADANKAAGELFLGSYSYDGTEHRVDEIDFSSRPSSLTFSYTYTSVNGEKGYAYFNLLDATGAVIATYTAELEAAPSVTSKTINFSSYPAGKKAAKIQLGFKSTTASVPAINVLSGTNLKESSVTALNFTNPPAINYSTCKAVATGSELTIHGVSLGYEYPGQNTAARPAKKSTKTRSTRR